MSPLSHRTLRLGLPLQLFAILALVPSFAWAQTFVPAPQTSLTVAAGSVFEIIAVSDLPSPSVSWILTKDSNFLGADRAPLFRTRLIDPGIYTLNAEVTGGADSAAPVREWQTIEIVVTENAPTPVTPDSATFIASTPSMDAQNRILLPAGQTILFFFPKTGIGQTLSADLDPLRDTNNDGIPDNDNDLAESRFASGENPLFVWLSSPVQRERSFSFSESDGSSLLLRIVDAVIAAAEPVVLVQRIAIEQKALPESAVAFDVSYLLGKPASPLLLTWKFGDGTQSLLDTPVHTYTANGTYTVNVQIRDLSTGTVIESGSTVLTVSSSTNTTETGAIIEPVAPSNNSFAFTITTIVKILLGGIVVAAIVMGLLFLVKKLMGMGSLQEKLERTEEKLIGKSPSDLSATPVPFSVVETAGKREPIEAKKTDAEETPPKREQAKESAKAAVTPPPLTEEQIPDWLKPPSGKGSGQKETPPTPPEQSKPTPLRAPRSAEQEKPKTPPPATATPPWLQTETGKPPVPPSPPSEQPKPAAPPAAVTPPPPSLPTPAVKAAPLPPAPPAPSEKKEMNPPLAKEKPAGPVPPWLAQTPSTPKPEEPRPATAPAPAQKTAPAKQTAPSPSKETPAQEKIATPKSLQNTNGLPGKETKIPALKKDSFAPQSAAKKEPAPEPQKNGGNGQKEQTQNGVQKQSIETQKPVEENPAPVAEKKPDTSGGQKDHTQNGAQKKSVEVQKPVEKKPVAAAEKKIDVPSEKKTDQKKNELKPAPQIPEAPRPPEKVKEVDTEKNEKKTMEEDDPFLNEPVAFIRADSISTPPPQGDNMKKAA
ncbi:MAG: PKD domain-containing protein [Candidatus Peregrinibacteria bacterium]